VPPRNSSSRRCSSSIPRTVSGILRALHLDKDWLEVVAGGKAVRVVDLKDALDDIIGPMVNRPVIVRMVPAGRHMKFLDIELDE
jgi:hypothetical protein